MWYPRIVARALGPDNARRSAWDVLAALAGTIWRWRVVIGVGLLVGVGALLLLRFHVPRAAMALPAVFLVGNEVSTTLRPRRETAPRSARRLAHGIATGVAAVVSVTLVTDAWWVNTVFLALMVVVPSASASGRQMAVVTAAASLVNFAIPAIANSIPGIPDLAGDLTRVFLVSVVVLPLLALTLHRRALHLLLVQRQLRDTVADLQRSQRALLETQGQIERANTQLHASVEFQTAALEERNRYLSIINSVSFALAEPMDSATSLERAARLIARLLGARAAQLYECGDEARNAQHLFVTVAPEDVHAPRLAETTLRAVATDGQPLVGGLPGAGDAGGAKVAFVDAADPYAVVPVAAKGRILGAFAVLGADFAWGDQQRHLLLLIGRELGAALESARLYRDAVERARLEEVAGEVGRLLSGTEAQDRAIQQGLQYLCRFLNARQTVLVGYQAEHREPTIIARAATELDDEGWLNSLAWSLPSLVSDRMRPLILGSGGEAPLSQATEAHGIGTLVVAPIIGTVGSPSMLPPKEATVMDASSQTRKVVAGVLVVAVPTGVPWKPASTDLLWRVTRLLAQRIQSDDLLALQRQRIRELSGLAEIAKTMQSGADTERLYAGFAQALQTLVKHRRLYIARLDEFGQLVEVPVFGPTGRGDSSGAFSPADRAHRWFSLRTATMWRASDGPAPSFFDADSRMCLVVPMRPKGQVLGVVALALDTVVTGDQLHIVEQAVEQLALALDNATLYQQATARASHIQALSNLARIVASVVDLREAFAAFGEEVRWLIPFDRAVMLLVDESGDNVETYATYPDDVEHVGAVPVDGSIASVPIAAGGAVVVRRNDPDNADLDWSILGPDVRDVAAVPVMQGSRAAAIFALVHSVESSLGPIDLDAMEEVAGLLGVTIERLRLYERAEYGANHDMLTDLPNYRYLQERLASLRAGISEPGESAVFMIDMDGLKLFNDSLGHEAGDQIIQIVARELRRICRSGDFVARTGGDEFVVVMEGVGPPTASVVADRIHEALRDAHLEVAGAPARIGVSIGIATAPGDADSVAGLMHAADQAMYEAKFAGGQRTRLASDRVSTRGTRSLPQRDTRLAETIVRAATDGATADERSAISLAQRWTVGLLTQLGEPVDEAPWVRMLVARDSLRAIATLRVGRDQQTARFFMDALHREWSGRDDATSQLVMRLAPIAVRLAWARVQQPELVGLDSEAAVAWTRERLRDNDDRGLAEALFAFVLADRMDRRGASAA